MVEVLQHVLFQASVWVIPVLTAITFHEAAHGYAAERFGDRTARMAGRVTLNPFRHVDPVGTVALPMLLLVMASPVLFGYAKPVPVRFDRLVPPRVGMALVALAGPAANMVLAWIAAFLVYLALLLPTGPQEWVLDNLFNALLINVILALFNLLPVLPLDGGRVVQAMLPAGLARWYGKSERYGLLLILGLLVVFPFASNALDMQFNISRWIIGTPVRYIVDMILGLTAIS